MRTLHLNHSTYQLQYHLVWGTKYRYKWLKDYVLGSLRKSFVETEKKYPVLKVLEFNADEDHIHLQIEIAPSVAISDVVSKLKSNSSIYLRKHFKFIKEMYIEKDGIWSTGYFISSIGINEKQVKKYIEWQNKKEKPQKSKLF